MKTSHALDTAPAHVREEATRHGIGSRYFTYEVAGSRVGVTALKAAFSAALAIALGVGAATVGGFLIFLALVFGIGAVLLAVNAFRAFESAGDAVYLFESGFVHSGGTAARAFTWTDINVLREVTADRTSTTYTFTVTRPDGERVVLDTDRFWEVAELGQEIEKRVTAAQFPLVLTAVGNGRTVGFGPLSVDATGLRDGRGPVSWDQVEHVSLRNGSVIVKEAGRPRARSHSISKVPNVFVLSAVAETLRGGG
jgi:hypothetical protein